MGTVLISGQVALNGLIVVGAESGLPTNLVATPDDGDKISLTWVDNSESESGYTVERRTGFAGAWTVVTSSLPPDTTSYDDTGRSRNIPYAYRVKRNGGVASSPAYATIVPSPRGTIATDGLVHNPPNIATITLPMAGGYFYDPTFGTKIWRATDPDTASSASFYPAYSYWPVLNSNNTRMLVQSSTDSRMRFMTFSDGPGATVTVAPNPPDGNPCPGQGAIWSASNPDVIYCHTNAGTKIYSYNVATQVYTQLANLSGVLANGGTLISTMQMSLDRNILTALVLNGSFNVVGAIAYKISTQTVLKQIANADVPYPIDETNITKNGRYFSVRLDNPATPGVTVFRVYDLNASPVTSADITASSPQNAPGHATYTTNGQIGYDSFNIGAVIGRDLSTPATNTNLKTIGFNSPNVDLSTLASDESWVTMSTNGLTTTPTGFVFQSEIFQIATAGNGASKQIAHDHTVEAPSGDYFAQPHAPISFDGRYIAWGSNMDVASGRIDLFIVDTVG